MYSGVLRAALPGHADRLNSSSSQPMPCRAPAAVAQHVDRGDDNEDERIVLRHQADTGREADLLVRGREASVVNGSLIESVGAGNSPLE
jgi:hypothetical protein